MQENSPNHDNDFSDLELLLQRNPSKMLEIPGYRTIEVCGQGGMGTVYKAWDLNIKREVAIKVIKKSSLRKKNILRFMRETKVTSQLEHSNIVRLYRQGETNDCVFFVMQYIEGDTLLSYIEKNKSSYREIVNIYIQILNGLEYAHRNKIIHRDLKPANIVVTPSGKPYIMDFGIAKVVGDDQGLTLSGEILGTPNYMSPEQIGKNKIEYKSDIFSLGIILYQLLTKELPFAGSNHIQIFQKIATEPPISLRKIDSEIPKNLENICNKALEKDKKMRYSAVEMRRDLNRFCNGKKIRPRKNLLFRNHLLLTFCLVVIFFGFYQQIFSSKTSLRLQSYAQLSLDQKIKYIDNLLSYKIEVKAEKHLRELLQQKLEFRQKEKIRKRYVVALVKSKKYDEAITVFSEIKRSIPPNVYLAIAKAFFVKKNFSQSLAYLKKIHSNYNSEEYYYLFGRIFLAMKQYRKAISYFDRIKKETLLVANSHFYHAKCLFQTQPKKQFEKIIYLLLKALPSFPQKVQVYEYLGHAYFANIGMPGSLEEATKYYQKCIDLSPHESRYYIYFAETQIENKKWNAAYKNIRTSLEKEPNNKKALVTMLKVTLKDSTRIYDCFQFMKHYVSDSFYQHIVFPNLFTDEIEQVQDTYETSYLQLQHVRKVPTNYSTFFAALADEKLDEYLYRLRLLALRNARYANNWEEKLYPILEKFKNNKSAYNHLQTIKTSIEEEREREYQQATYYLIAKLFLDEKKYLLQETRKYVVYVEKILQNDSEKILVRFLAAHALSRLMEYEKLEHMRSKNKMLDAICSITLRLSGFPIETDHIIEIVYDVDSILLKCLGIQSLYNKFLLDKTHNLFFIEMLGNDNFQIKAYAAAGMWWDKRAIGVLSSCIEKKEDDYRYFGHYFIWKNSEEKFWKRKSHLVDKALTDKSKKVRAILLERLDGKVGSLFYKYTYIAFQKYSDDMLLCRAFSNIVRMKTDTSLLYSFFVKTDKPNKIRQQSSLVKVFCFIDLLTQLTDVHIISFGKRERMRGMEDVRRMIRTVGKITNLLPTEKDLYLKMIAYFMTSVFEFRSLRNLPKEKNPNIKAHILLGFCIQSTGQPIPKSVPKEMRRAVRGAWNFLTFNYRTESDRKIEGILQKLMRSSHSHVRGNAHAARIFWWASKNKEIQYHDNGDSFLRKNLATAFHYLVYVKILNATSLIHRRERNSLEKHQWNYVETLQRLANDRAKCNEYIKFLDQSIELDKSSVYPFLARGLLYRELGKRKQAISDWLQIQSPQTPLLSYYLALELYASGENKQAEKFLRYIDPDSYVTIEKVAALCFQHRNDIIAEKMFKKLFQSKKLKAEDGIKLYKIYKRQQKMQYAQQYLMYLNKMFPNNKMLKVD